MIRLFSLKQQKKDGETLQKGGNQKKASAAQLRITKDLSELNLPRTCYTEFPDPDDLLNFKLIISPDEGFYRSGKFVFSFRVGSNYPHEPPKVKCETHVYHPNIDLDGNVCLNILREDWKPVLTINSIVYGLQYLFLEPNPEDPLNKDAAELLQSNRRLFEQNVQKSLRGGYLGVLWMQRQPFPGAADTVKLLKSIGKKVFFVSNNCGKTRAEFLQKLQDLKFDAHLNEAYCSSYVLACYLEDLKFKDKVYLIGTHGISEELDNKNIKHTGIGPDHLVEHLTTYLETVVLDNDVRAVAVGYDPYLSYPKLLKAASYLRDPNCLFVAANADEKFPSPRHDLILPDAGCTLYALQMVTGRKATVVGKPNPHIFECIQKEHHLNANRTLIIGDRINTDIHLGYNCGLHTMLVFTGVTSKNQLEMLIEQNKNANQKHFIPEYCLPSLAHLSHLIQKQ